MKMVAELLAGIASSFWPHALELAPTLIGIALYAVFIFHFYQFLGRRDILSLHEEGIRGPFAFVRKMFAEAAYVTEHLVLTPIFIALWFSVIAVLLFMLSDQPAQNIVLLSISLVGAVRLTSYYNEDLSKDLAKLLPLVLLGVFLVDSSFFSFEETIQKITQLGDLTDKAVAYIALIVVLELVLRMLHFLWITAVKRARREVVQEKK